MRNRNGARTSRLLASAALALIFAAPALAQEALPERLYLGSGILVGSTRFIGLAGAYVGIAEGADGLASNFAAVAHRNPRREGRFDWDLTLSGFGAPATGARDLDNDGLPDDANQSRDLLLAGLMQFGKIGFGFHVRSSAMGFTLADTPVYVTRVLAGAGAGFSLKEDQLVFGIAFFGGWATFEAGKVAPYNYAGSDFEGGFLWRPLRRPFRIGLAVKQQTVGAFTPAEGRKPVLDLPGRPTPLYSGIVSPTTASVGLSARLGPGAERYNRLSKSALADDPQAVADTDFDHPPGTLLVTMQLDLIAAVQGATSLSPVTRGTPAEVVGGGTYLVPRAGVEHETLVKRLRLRVGAYLEPSPFVGHGPRPHATGGAELLAFHLVDDWTLDAAFDLAPRYYSVGLGVGFWR